MSQRLDSKPWITNFGRNLRFQPQTVYTPRDEQELLRQLASVKGRKIRVVGRRHAWSRGIETDDVLFDLRHLNGVRVEQRGDQHWATIGAGCQIKRVLAELESQAGLTLQAIGLITEQTIAGACATGTHGSGKHSFSHYIEEVRIAAYDPQTGEPTIRTITDGPELRAARCSLGCLGIVVSVGLRCIPQYYVEDHFRRYQSLDDILAAESEYPIQQFYYLPWLWMYYAQHRRIVQRKRSLLSLAYRWYTFIALDVSLHLVFVVLARLAPIRSWIHIFFRWIGPAAVIQGWRAIGKSQAMLVMEHELFRHIEMELFVTRENLQPALDLIRVVQQYLDGQADAISETLQQQLEGLGLWKRLDDKVGTYTHHYHTSIRKVLPDDTLISMASSAVEPYYALSIISYSRPAERQKFLDFTEFLARCMIELFNARPHWGKICPLTAEDANRLYPHLEEFRQIARRYDPDGVFRNAWVNQVLFGEKSSP